MRREPDAEWASFQAGVEAVLAEFQRRGGHLADAERKRLGQALADRDRSAVRDALTNQILLAVWINPESRVKVARGKGPAELVQGREGVFLIEVANDAGAKGQMRLRISSGPDTAGLFTADLVRKGAVGDRLDGTSLQYLLVTVRCREAGRREAVFLLDAGQGTQDLGFRSEIPVLFRITPADGKR